MDRSHPLCILYSSLSPLCLNPASTGTASVLATSNSSMPADTFLFWCNEQPGRPLAEINVTLLWTLHTVHRGYELCLPFLCQHYPCLGAEILRQSKQKNVPDFALTLRKMLWAFSKFHLSAPRRLDLTEPAILQTSSVSQNRCC